MKFRSRPLFQILLIAGSVVLAESCSTPRLAPNRDAWVSQTGKASWYGKAFQGRRTASGESFDMNQFTCAHPSLPFGTRVRVTNLSNGKSVVVTVNDRGPYAGGRIVDVSYRAAQALGFAAAGITTVRLEPLSE